MLSWDGGACHIGLAKFNWILCIYCIYWTRDNYFGFSNLALSEIGRGCKFLQALHLVDCSSISDDAICSIAKGCKNLKKFHIRQCYEVVHSFAIFASPFYSWITVSLFSYYLIYNYLLGPIIFTIVFFVC